eukprot:3777495-Amphidinium_carterae.1
MGSTVLDICFRAQGSCTLGAKAFLKVTRDTLKCENVDSKDVPYAMACKRGKSPNVSYSSRRRAWPGANIG